MSGIFMDNASTINQLIISVTTICTSLITFVIGPLLLRWLDNRKENFGLMVGSRPDKKEYAFTSLVLGVINVFSGVFPICGMPITIATAIFGIAGYNSSRRTLAILGLVLAVIGCCINMFIMSYVLTNGFTIQVS